MRAAARRPVALTSGDPAGIGPEIAARAWAELRNQVPFVWVGDPRHLPGTVPFRVVDAPAAALTICAEALPVLPHPFAAPATPGTPSPENARGVVEVIEPAVT